MKKLLLLALATLSLQAQTYLAPQGDWTLCRLGVQMPDCVLKLPETYMLMTDYSVPWTLTATLESGDIVTVRGAGQTLDLYFGGVVTHWNIVFRKAARR